MITDHSPGRFQPRSRFAGVVLLALGIACGHADAPAAPPPPPTPIPTPTPTPSSIAITRRTDTLSQLVSVPLVATVRGSAGQVLTAPVRWTSLNERIATVDSNGVLVPRKPGAVRIVASTGAVADTATMTVGMHWLSIAGSWGFGTCGIGGDSTGYCWGTVFDKSFPKTAPTRPAEVSADLRFASLGIGWFYACGLVSDGSVYCWGLNEFGEFGALAPATSTTPVRVATTVKFTRLSAGADHVCALSAGGDVYCWGDDSRGQLGSGHFGGFDPTPKKVAGIPLTITSLAMGFDHSCALAANGQAFCWGENEQGNVGNGTITVYVTTPVLVAGSLAFKDISGRPDGVCGIAVSGGAYCWGASYSLSDAAPTLVPSSSAYTAIAGSGYIQCGLTAAGMLCRGNNFWGSLGLGTVASADNPTLIPGSANFIKMAVGVVTTCAIDRSGAAYCWGDNVYGQVGDGTSVTRFTPTRVLDPIYSTP